MRELGVGRVGDDPGLEPRRRTVPRQSGQEAGEPAGERGRRQHAPHQVGLAEAGREEVLARRLIGEGAVAVGAVEVAAARDDERLRRRVARHAGPVEHEAQGEGRLRVLAHADGACQLGQPVADPPGRRFLERRERRRPPARLGRAPLPELGGELQQPREAVRPLEADPALPLEVGHLGGDVRRSEAARQRPAGLGGEGRLRQPARDAREKPVAVDRGVPVVAAEECRGQLARRPGVRVGEHHVRDLVRVLLVDAGEGKAGEALRKGGIDRPGGRGEEGGKKRGGEHARS